MTKESYAESIRIVVRESNIVVFDINELKRLVFLHRKKFNLLKTDDLEYLRNRKPHKNWEHRIHAGLETLKNNKECSFIKRSKYKFTFEDIK